MKISTLTSLRDVTEKPPEKKHHQTNFYSHISARCDQIASDVVAGGYDFYSHISARCDSVRWETKSGIIISTLTSLRDVTCQIATACRLRYFYSHISARCDSALRHAEDICIISTLTSLRDVTWFGPGAETGG